MFPPDFAPYIQDIAGSIEHCPVAVSPAMSVINALAVLSCCYDNKGKLTDVMFFDRSRTNGKPIDYKYIYGDLGEYKSCYVYDENGRLMDNAWITKNGDYPNSKQIRIAKDHYRYEDVLEFGHLKTRIYPNIEVIENYSNTEPPNQVIRLEQIYKRINVKKEYVEYYDNDFKLVSQSIRAQDIDNPMNIFRDEHYIHFYRGYNIAETIVTSLCEPQYGFYRYAFSHYRRSNWGMVKIFRKANYDEQEKLHQTVEREFAFKQEEISALYEKYKALKERIPIELPF